MRVVMEHIYNVVAIHPQRIDMLIDELENCGVCGFTPTERSVMLDCLRLAKQLRRCSKTAVRVKDEEGEENLC